jgi:hypothetical protein
MFSKGDTTGTERVLNSHTQAPISKIMVIAKYEFNWCWHKFAVGLLFVLHHSRLFAMFSIFPSFCRLPASYSDPCLVWSDKVQFHLQQKFRFLHIHA